MNIDILKRSYKKNTKHSNLLYKKSLRFFPGGISHNIRFFTPYPFFVKKATGKYLLDVDGITYTDYWMGHWALILGHSPKNVSLALSKQVKNGTLYGTVNTTSIELAETIQKLMPNAEKMRFATTGSEATMYAVRLARAVTRKKIIVKIIGGWHGFNSSLLESVNYPFEINEGLGLDVDNKYIQSIPFNDLHTSLQLLNKIKDDLACIIVEPILGGAFNNEENIKIIRQNSCVVYLAITEEEAYERLKDVKDRPLLLVNGDLKQSIKEIMGKRLNIYSNNCDFKIDINGKSPSKIKDEIISYLNLH